MDRLYLFIVRNDVWILILSAFGLVWYAAELYRARRSLRSAMFGLELESGRRRRNRALIFISLFLALIGIVYVVNARIAPSLPPELLGPPTPTPDIFRTPLSSPTPLESMLETRPPTPDLAATATLGSPLAPGEESATAEPTATEEIPPTPFVDCTVDLNISQPRDGAVVSTVIRFEGTADTDDFGAYRLETNGPQTNGVWSSLLGRDIDQPVRESFLGTTTLTNWQPGPYLIRLVVVDDSGTTLGTCVIQVTLAE